MELDAMEESVFILSESIREIIKDNGLFKWREAHFTVTEIKGGFQIEYGRMYEAPSISFEQMKKLSELLGTDKINIDNYSIEGCETCGWGSDYGHTIQIYQPTKYVEELKASVGKDLFETQKP